MYVLIELYHECKTDYITVNLVGTYETFNDFDKALAHEVESRRRTDGFEDDWALYPNRGWVRNESLDTWEWMSFTTDGSIPINYTVSAFEFGFDEED